MQTMQSAVRNMPNRNSPKEFVEEWIERVWRQRDYAAIDEMRHPDSTFTEIAGGTWESKGPAKFRQNVELFHRLLTDMDLGPWNLIEEDNRGAYGGYITGRICDPSMGPQLLGKQYYLRLMSLCRIENGLVVQGYNFFSSNQPDLRLPGMQETENFAEPHLPYDIPDPTDKETSRKVTLEWLEHAWSAKGVDNHERWLHPDCLISEMASANLETRGVAAIEANLAELRRVVGDLTPHVITTVAEGNKVACVFNLSGIIREALTTSVMIGSKVEIRAMILATLQQGRIAHAYSFIDFSQFGSALPAP